MENGAKEPRLMGCEGARQVRTWLAAVLTAGVAVGLVGLSSRVGTSTIDVDGCKQTVRFVMLSNEVNNRPIIAYMPAPDCGAP